MNVGDEVNGYRILTAPTNAGGGMSQWSFAQKGDAQYFVKMFLAPKYPLDTGPGSPASKARKRQMCLAFEERHLEIQRRLDPDMPGGGNLVVTRDFFRVESTYVKVMDRIDAAELPAAHELSPHQLLVILRTLVFSLRLLHDKHVVHGDLKPDNVLVQRGGEDLYISKLIDFDEAYVAGQPPVAEQIVGDPGYYSPELLRYIKKDPAVPGTALGLAADMFSMGLLLHSFLARDVPLFDRDAVHYPAEAVLAGMALDLGGAPVAIQPLLAGLLQPNPAARPGIGAVVDFLATVDPATLLPARSVSTTTGPTSLLTTRPSEARRRLADPATTRASGEWPARVRPASPAGPSGPTAAPVPPAAAADPAATTAAPPTDPAGELRISMGRRKRLDST